MSAGFMYANYDICKKDIRHIYSGQAPADIRFRIKKHDSGIDHLERLFEMQTKPRRPRQPLCWYEYIPRYGAAIPRAPAFRQLPKSDIKKLVTRLHGNKSVEERKILKQIETNDIGKETAMRCKSARHELRVTSERIDVDALVHRLYYNGKTHVSKLRQREPVIQRNRRPQTSRT